MSKETLIKNTKRIVVDFMDINEALKYFVNVESEGAIPKKRDYIPLLADEACVSSCEHLYDLGIRTVASGANVDGKEDVCDNGFVAIDYTSLSDENKSIANDLERKGIIDPIERNPNQRGCFRVNIKTPLTSDSTVGEVEERLLNVSNMFLPQDVLYGRFTMEDLKSEFIYNPDGTIFWRTCLCYISKEEAQELIDERLDKLFYDGEKYYYVTEDLLNIHLNYLKRNKQENK